MGGVGGGGGGGVITFIVVKKRRVRHQVISSTVHISPLCLLFMNNIFSLSFIQALPKPPKDKRDFQFRSYMSWKDEDMQTAIHNVNNLYMSVSQAARECQIPRQTLQDHLKYSDIKKPGRQRLLNSQQELSLRNFTIHLSDLGHGLNYSMIAVYAGAILRTISAADAESKQPCYEWARQFVKRNELAARMANQVERLRILSCEESIVFAYFDLLANVIEEHSINPMRIYNVDECGFGKKLALREKIICKKGCTSPYVQSVFEGEHVSLVACIGTSGDVLPSALVYTRSVPTERYLELLPHQWTISSTPSGYVDEEKFYSWMEDIFIKHTHPSPTNPVLLLMDNHSAHLSARTMQLAYENSVFVVTQPPHSSHFLQPLDAIFGLLKDSIAACAHAAQLINGSAQVRKGNLIKAVEHGMDKSWSKHVVKNGFLKTGAYPVDRTKVDTKWLVKKKVTPSDAAAPSTPAPTPPTPCSTCGISPPPPHPLRGTISESLESVLVLPNSAALCSGCHKRVERKEMKKPSNRRISGARFMTHPEILQQLKDKEASRKKKKPPKNSVQPQDAANCEDTEDEIDLLTEMADNGMDYTQDEGEEDPPATSPTTKKVDKKKRKKQPKISAQTQDLDSDNEADDSQAVPPTSKKRRKRQSKSKSALQAQPACDSTDDVDVDRPLQMAHRRRYGTTNVVIESHDEYLETPGSRTTSNKRQTRGKRINFLQLLSDNSHDRPVASCSSVTVYVPSSAPASDPVKECGGGDCGNPEIICSVIACGSQIFECDQYALGCDSETCNRWFHRECLDAGDQAKADLSIMTDSDWLCPICVQTLDKTCEICMLSKTVISSAEKILWAKCSTCPAQFHLQCMEPREAQAFERYPDEWCCRICL